MTMDAAREMAQRRWKRASKTERAEVGKALTEARKSIPPERRAAIAKKAAAARWASQGKKKLAKKA